MSSNPGKLGTWFTIWNDFKTQLELLEMKVFMENLLQMAINTEDIMFSGVRPNFVIQDPT
jgi:hypothetical protein